MALDSAQDHLSRNAVEIPQNLFQKDLAIQPVAVAIIAGMRIPLADLFEWGLVSPCLGHLPQEDPKEVAVYVPNRSDLSGFLGTYHFRNGRSRLFEKVDGNPRDTEELSCVGNRQVGDALGHQKHGWLDAPAGGGYRIQKALLV